MTDALPPPPQNFGTVAIFLSDGQRFDLTLPVPWNQYIAQLVTVGALIHENAYIARPFIIRMHLLQPAGAKRTEGGEEGNVVSLFDPNARPASPPPEPLPPAS